MKIKEFIKVIADNLPDIDNRQTEVLQIAAHLTGFSRSQLFLKSNDLVTDKLVSQAVAIAQKRNKHYPLQYILGSVEFYNVIIKVNPSVLIPRPETELLVDIILKDNCSQMLDVLDLCTGSGAIAIALKKERIHWNIDASDISKPALETAKQNAKFNLMDVDFIESNIFNNISRKYDLIISNPPYISDDDYQNLDPELGYEPVNALVAEHNGLFFYEKIISQAQNYLKPNGRIYLEIGAGQARDITKLAQIYKIGSAIIKKDYNDFDRFAILI